MPALQTGKGLGIPLFRNSGKTNQTDVDKKQGARLGFALLFKADSYVKT